MMQLLDVRPTRPVEDSADLMMGYAVAPSDLSCRQTLAVKSTNRRDVGLSEFGDADSRTDRLPWPGAVAGESPLRRSVSHVVGMGAEEQVSGIRAGRIVAAVENIDPLGDRAAMDRPREPMGANLLAVDHEAAVTLFIWQSEPPPARITVGSDDVQPEALFMGKSRGQVTAGQESVAGLDGVSAAAGTRRTGIISVHLGSPPGCHGAECLQHCRPFMMPEFYHVEDGQ